MPKTVKMATLCREKKPSKTTGNSTTQNANQTTRRPRERTFPFELPPGLNITPAEYDVLAYAYASISTIVEEWPVRYRRASTIENLIKKRYLRRKYFPTRCYLTKQGVGAVTWIDRLREHAEP